MPGPPFFHSAERRYRDDPEFHGMVDMLEAYIHRATLTASEVREAATLAAIHYEMRTGAAARRMFVATEIAKVGAACIPEGVQLGPPPVVIVDGHHYKLED